jgi:tryptophanyl-tRNA synthetase
MTDQRATEHASFLAARERSRELEAGITANPGAYRVLTGDRPTGDLHLGHYLGSIKNRVRLQELGVETLILIADMQVITDREQPGEIRKSVYSLLADQLACGIDPTRSPIFVHSAVPALNELMVFLLALISDSELRRNPTVKAELEASARPMSGLMLTYPVHQAADILFCDANVVPGGRDQLPHVDTARVLGQRFNSRYGVDVFTAPETLLSEIPLLLGLDGQKMSKSRGNTIKLAHTADQTAKLIRKALTDQDPQITYDPVERPGVSNLLTMIAGCLDITPDEVLTRYQPYGGGGLKQLATEVVNETLAPIRARRIELAADETHLRNVLTLGNMRANKLAQAKLEQVREAMGYSY